MTSQLFLENREIENQNTVKAKFTNIHDIIFVKRLKKKAAHSTVSIALQYIHKRRMISGQNKVQC